MSKKIVIVTRTNPINQIVKNDMKVFGRKVENL